MIKTAIENDQNMIVEGCYFPYDWKRYFEQEYLKDIKFICLCLVMTSKYIEKHFDDIRRYASVIENRGEDDYCKKELLLRDNRICLEMCKKYGCEYLLIDDEYRVDINIGDILVQ